MAGTGMGLATGYGAGGAADAIKNILARRLAETELQQRQQAQLAAQQAEQQRIALAERSANDERVYRDTVMAGQQADRDYRATRDTVEDGRRKADDDFKAGERQRLNDAWTRVNTARASGGVINPEDALLVGARDVHALEDPAYHEKTHVLPGEDREHKRRMSEISAQRTPMAVSDEQIRRQAAEQATNILNSPNGVMYAGGKNHTQLTEEIFQSMKGQSAGPQQPAPGPKPVDQAVAALDGNAKAAGGYGKLLESVRANEQTMRQALGDEGYQAYLAEVHKRAKGAGETVPVKPVKKPAAAPAKKDDGPDIFKRVHDSVNHFFSRDGALGMGEALEADRARRVSKKPVNK